MKRTNRAVLVGVGRYEKPRMPALKAPVSDVERLGRLLAQGDFDVNALTDKDASKAAFETAARRLLRDAKPSDCVLFYYSGHGVKDPDDNLWLTTGSFDPDGDPYDGGVRAADIRQWGREGSAGQVVLIFDCCFAGAAAGRAAGPVVNADDFAARRHGRGTHVLMASDRNRMAPTGDEPTPDGRPSHFTELLVFGLEGDAAPGADSVTMVQLSTFLLQRGAAQLGHPPVVSIEEGQGDFPLVRVPDPDITLIDRPIRDAAQSPNKVARVGAVSLLSAVLAEPKSDRHAEAARRLLIALRDAAGGDNDVRQAARQALSGPAVSVTGLERALGEVRQERDAALTEARRQEERARAADRQAEADAADYEAEVARLQEAIRTQREEQRRLGISKDQELAILDRQRAELAAELSDARLRSRSMAERLHVAELEIERLKDRPDTRDEELDRLLQERDALRTEVVEAKATASRLSTETAELQRRLDETVRALETRDEQIARGTDALGEETARAAALERELSKARGEFDRQFGEKQRELKELVATLAKERSRAATLSAEVGTLKQANEALRAARDRIDGEMAALGDRATKAEALAATLRESAERAAAEHAAERERLERELSLATGGASPKPARAVPAALVAVFIAASLAMVSWQEARDARREVSNARAERDLAVLDRGKFEAAAEAAVQRALAAEDALLALRGRAAAANPQAASAPAGTGASSPATAAPGVTTSLPPLVATAALPNILVGETPVTVGQFRAYLRVANATPPRAGCRTPNGPPDDGLNWEWPGFRQGDDHPVVCVSYTEAMGYVSWLRSQTRRSDFRLLSADERMRLVTFRYATRDTIPAATSRCALGNIKDESLRQALLGNPDAGRAAPNLLRSLRDRTSTDEDPTWAACQDNSAFTSPVGGGTRIGGVADLMGNVVEWTSDIDPERRQPLVVGLGWGSPILPRDNQVLWRGDYNANSRSNLIGFRVSRNP